MKLEQPNLIKNEMCVKNLEEILPFLKQSEERASFNSKLKNLGDFIGSGGNIDNVLKTASKLRSEQPEESKFTNEEKNKFLSVRASIAEQLGYKVLENKGKRLTLEKEKFTIYLKHLMLPSFSSYKGGRINEINIVSNLDEKMFLEFHYDKLAGSKNKEIRSILDELVQYLN